MSTLITFDLPRRMRGKGSLTRDAIGLCWRLGYREVRWDELPQDPKGINMDMHL